MGKFASALKAGQTAAQFANDANNARNAANDFRKADKRQMGRDAGRYAFSEGANTGKTMGKTWLKTFEVIPRIVVRTLQFILALVAVGFYGHRTHRAFAWDASLWIAWLVVFGIFAGIFLKRKSDEPYKGAGVGAMKTAVWVDLVNAILWMGSAGYGCCKTFLGRKVDEASDKVGNKLFSRKGGNAHEMKNYPESVV
ncbi:hypothetical protein LLEC1_02390 [Akanthomyces lecanii]|uniref:MARVEL domain-containing protein n=1 Tax=Cordyceps confragosa TaxID=2714763 RepID=A0A179IJM5_CORDF|nr:hypothetical protein LLEC1_02390 [Akanthomyces lecanii]